MNPFIHSHKRLAAFCILMLGMCIYGTAQAQTTWDTNVLTIVAPTQCATGEPITACPVTGYRYERSATSGGTYATVGTTGPAVLTFTHTGVTAGLNCYRAFALSANGDSVASNISCKTNTKPVGPPNPPTLTIAALVLNVPLDSLDGFKRTPVFSITASGPGVLMGFCKVSTPSVEDSVAVYRGQRYCKPLLLHPRTGAANIAWIGGVTPTQEVIAPCA